MSLFLWSKKRIFLSKLPSQFQLIFFAAGMANDHKNRLDSAASRILFPLFSCLLHAYFLNPMSACPVLSAGVRARWVVISQSAASARNFKDGSAEALRQWSDNLSPRHSITGRLVWLCCTDPKLTPPGLGVIGLRQVSINVVKTRDGKRRRLILTKAGRTLTTVITIPGDLRSQQLYKAESVGFGGGGGGEGWG